MEKRKCFVVGPFGTADSETRIWSDFLMENVIKFAISDQYDVSRTIDDPEAGNIVNRIMRDLQDADVVIGDISDNNANVFYEIGFRAARDLPFVLVRRACAQPSCSETIPFVLSTFESINVEAEYDKARGRYMLAEAARTISDLRAQVAKAIAKPRPPELVQQGAYRVRMFRWITQYSMTIATDWLESQNDDVKQLIDEYERGTRPKVTGNRLRALAEYLELKAAANQMMEGTAIYFVNTQTKEINPGFALYSFPNQMVVIKLRGREDREKGTAELKFEQPGRQVAVGDVRTELPPYKFVVQFTNQSSTLKGRILHPETSTIVGEAELEPQMGFAF